MNQLVAFISSAAKRVKHRVNNGIQHTHTETCDKGADNVDRETFNTVPAGHILEKDADKAQYDCQQGRVLIADLFQKKTGRDTHYCVSNKIGGVTQLRFKVRSSELILNNNAHRITKVRDECNHSKQQEHHNDG